MRTETEIRQQLEKLAEYHGWNINAELHIKISFYQHALRWAVGDTDQL